MNTSKISSKFQVVIPKNIRCALGLQPGQRLHVRMLGGNIELEPERTLASLKGRWPDLDTRVMRETDRVF